MEKRRVKFDGKWVDVDRDDGWGDPPTWYLDFSDGSRLVVRYALEDTQLGVVQRLQKLNRDGSLDKYLLELAQTDWKCVGREDDVEKRILEHFGYTRESQVKDYARLTELNRLMVQSSGRFVQNMEIDLVHTNKNSFNQLADFEEMFGRKFTVLTENIKKLKVEAAEVQTRIVFSDRLFNGEQVGLDWSNESFLAKYWSAPGTAEFCALVGWDLS